MRWKTRTHGSPKQVGRPFHTRSSNVKGSRHSQKYVPKREPITIIGYDAPFLNFRYKGREYNYNPDYGIFIDVALDDARNKEVIPKYRDKLPSGIVTLPEEATAQVYRYYSNREALLLDEAQL